MIILGKGTVITRDADRPIIYDGAVAIDGTQIVDIGIYDELCKTYVNAEIIDAHGGDRGGGGGARPSRRRAADSPPAARPERR